MTHVCRCHEYGDTACCDDCTVYIERDRYKAALEWISKSSVRGATTGSGHADCIKIAIKALGITE